MYSNELIVKILNYLDNNLYKQISINELANRFSYNKDYIMRLFKKEIGCTIIDYINTKRIFNSLNSYKSNISILRISLEYGYSSLEYYSEIFKKIMKVNPSTYRKFIKNDINIDINDIYIIQDRLVSIEYFIHKCNSYKNNIDTNEIRKVLSIFK